MATDDNGDPRGSMPWLKYLVVDHLPAGVLGSDPLNPVFTKGFLECAQHRGFIVDPARAGHPLDKPKTETRGTRRWMRSALAITSGWITGRPRKDSTVLPGRHQLGEVQLLIDPDQEAIGVNGIAKQLGDELEQW